MITVMHVIVCSHPLDANRDCVKSTEQ